MQCDKIGISSESNAINFYKKKQAIKMIYNNSRSLELNQLFCLIKYHFMDPQVATKYTSRCQPRSLKTSFLINNL